VEHKVFINATGVWISDHPQIVPTKLIDIDNKDNQFHLNVNSSNTVDYGIEELVKVNIDALEAILLFTNRKHIYVTLSCNKTYKIDIDKLLNRGDLLYLKNSNVNEALMPRNKLWSICDVLV
jgi:hypothetical protein